MALSRLHCCLLLAGLLAGNAASAATSRARGPPEEPGADGIILKMESDPLAMERSGFHVQSAAAADAAGALGRPIGRHLRRIKLRAGEQLEQRLQHLRGMQGVTYAVPDMRIFPHRVRTTDDAAAAAAPARATAHEQEVAEMLHGLSKRKTYEHQWGAGRIGLPAAWSIATGSASKAGAVNLCVVDSGVDLKHPDLVANLVAGFSAVDGDDEDRPDDQVGHGTTVHGVIAATGAGGGILGVNWGNINVMPCKFMSAAGWGQTSDAIQCLDWCIGQKASIISASWSSGQLGNQPLEEAMARTQAAGVLLVVSAGNQGADMARTPYFPQAYSAQFDNMLVVAATDEYDEHAFFSNYNPHTVHLSAPGQWIYSTIVGGGYNFSSGTSIAAPFVSGSAALLLAAAQDRLGKTLSAIELKAALMDSSEKVKALKGRTATGARLRTDWALQELLGLELSQPTPCQAKPGDKKKCRGADKQSEGGSEEDSEQEKDNNKSEGVVQARSIDGAERRTDADTGRRHSRRTAALPPPVQA